MMHCANVTLQQGGVKPTNNDCGIIGGLQLPSGRKAPERAPIREDSKG